MVQLLLPSSLQSKLGKLMEVCVDCVSSAVNAEAGGASRIELCSALSEGGLTPSVGFLKVVKTLVNIPVFVMIRPRRGMDFIYSDMEIEEMEIDITVLKEAGANGFVFGALTPSKEVNSTVCRRLLKAAEPLPCTFHRAFDVLTDPLKELETIIALGFKRILTSGQEQSASLGVKLIKDLIINAKGRVVILPGAGITKSNLEFILNNTNAKEFHASARTEFKNDETSSNVAMGSSDFNYNLFVTNRVLVQEMVNIGNKVWNETKH